LNLPWSFTPPHPALAPQVAKEIKKTPDFKPDKDSMALLSAAGMSDPKVSIFFI